MLHAVIRIGTLFLSNLLCFVLLLAVFDLAFRGYEQLVLVKSLDATQETYNLKSLGYNDGNGDIRARLGGADTGPEAAVSPRRILSFGDSFAFGVTQPAYNYGEVMARQLNATAPGPGFQVCNLGRPEISFPGYISESRFWTERLDYDAAVFLLYIGNDVLDTYKIDPSTPVATPETIRYGLGALTPRMFWLRAWDYFYTNYVAIKSLKELTDRRYTNALFFPYSVYLAIQAEGAAVYTADGLREFPWGWRWCRTFLEECRRLEASGKKVLVAVAPPHFILDNKMLADVAALQHRKVEDYQPFMPGQAVKEMARELGVRGPVVDLTPCLRRHDASQVQLGLNTHWSVEGNAIVGDLLAQEVRAAWCGGEDAPECLNPATPSPAARAVTDAVMTAP